MDASPNQLANDFDPIETEVFYNRLLSISDEVMKSLIRSSFSTNIKERRDASVALFDAKGRLICQALYIPMLLSGVLGGVETLIKQVDPKTIEPNDAFICNDAYMAGGTHSPDITIITPVFHENELVFYIGNICHHADVGGIVPGSTDHTLPSIFAEGIRIPLLKLVRKGQLDEQLINLIAVNTRDSVERILDLKVQIASNEKGVKSLQNLLAISGISRINKAIDNLLTYTERRMRRRIEELPDGEFHGESWTDDEGLPGPPKCIRLCIKIFGDALDLDFSGTDSQARGAINITHYPLLASCFIGLNSVIDPEIPTNDGMFRTVKISAPEGSILNPKFPAAIGNREFAGQRVIRAIFLAMSKALPIERVLAPSSDMNIGMAFSGHRRSDGTPFVYFEAVAGGIGALYKKDGMHGAQVGITNSANTPTEALELEFPLFINEYGLESDSVGAGRTQGGAGIIRDIRALADDVTVSTRADGKFSPAPGIFGGHDGGRSSLKLRKPDGLIEEIDMYLVDYRLNENESVRLVSPGGAGFGVPQDRDVRLIKEDIRNGFITEEFAQRHYGNKATSR